MQQLSQHLVVSMWVWVISWQVQSIPPNTGAKTSQSKRRVGPNWSDSKSDQYAMFRVKWDHIISPPQKQIRSSQIMGLSKSIQIVISSLADPESVCCWWRQAVGWLVCCREVSAVVATAMATIAAIPGEASYNNMSELRCCQAFLKSYNYSQNIFHQYLLKFVNNLDVDLTKILLHFVFRSKLGQPCVIRGGWQFWLHEPGHG